MRLQLLLEEGTSSVTRWEPAVRRLYADIAHVLPSGISVRQFGDVHLDAHAVQMRPHASIDFGQLLVVYLGKETVNLTARFEDGTIVSLAARPRNVLLLPQRAQLFHSHAVPLAWLRILPLPRSIINFYGATWIQHHFVSPHRSKAEIDFLRAHTRHPVFWHAFVWSFFGMLFSVLAMMPLAWRILTSIDVKTVQGPETLGPDAANGIWPTLLTHGARTISVPMKGMHSHEQCVDLSTHEFECCCSEP
jgi:hypothetical protein